MLEVGVMGKKEKGTIPLGIGYLETLSSNPVDL